MSTRKFKTAIKDHWNTSELAEATGIVYGSTPDERYDLRDLVTTAIIDHADRLLGKPEIEAVMRAIPGLAYGLSKKKVSSVCSSCRTSSLRPCTFCKTWCVQCNCQPLALCGCCLSIYCD